MPLPIVESPKYVLTIPSTGQSIEYRPFLVKEEKILLLAQESEKPQEMMSAIKEIVRACTFNLVDPNQLTSFDLEYIFLKLRAKSVGEITDIRCKCNYCEVYTEVSINIDEIQVSFPEKKVDNKIMLTDTIGVVLRHIRVNDITEIVNAGSANIEVVTCMIIASIESIFDENGVYDSENSSKEELNSFVNSLNRKQLGKIEEFVASAPKLEHEIKFQCTSCKKDNSSVVSGTQAFFE